MDNWVMRDKTDMEWSMATSTSIRSKRPFLFVLILVDRINIFSFGVLYNLSDRRFWSDVHDGNVIKAMADAEKHDENADEANDVLKKKIYFKFESFNLLMNFLSIGDIHSISLRLTFHSLCSQFRQDPTDSITVVIFVEFIPKKSYLIWKELMN